MQSTADEIEKRLFNRQAGGLFRYEGDTYAGGNPWVIATLWMSIFRSLQGQKDKAAEYLKWAEANSSPAGLLPEQVHRDNGGPAWVLPLNWSQAMYVLASLALSGKLSSAATDRSNLV
jgi:GH15 family glucan-1,4-alpha-glucosidase